MRTREMVKENLTISDGWIARAHDIAEKLSKKILIDGELCPSLSQDMLKVIHPGDLSVIGHVPRCYEADVNVAVEAVDTKRASPPVLGNVKVFEALSECGAP